MRYRIWSLLVAIALTVVAVLPATVAADAPGTVSLDRDAEYHDQGARVVLHATVMCEGAAASFLVDAVIYQVVGRTRIEARATDEFRCGDGDILVSMIAPTDLKPGPAVASVGVRFYEGAGGPLYPHATDGGQVKLKPTK